jgi:type IV pilus assembly protein PilQ
MMARRLVTTLALVALVSNLSVFAGANARPEAQAFALVSLKHETVGPVTRILIESSAPPLYTVFRPTDRLIVVDLPGGEASRLAPEYRVKDSLVDRVMVRRAAGPAGRAVARIEVSVKSDVRDRSVVDGNTLVLEISPEAKTTAAGATAAKDNAESREPKRVSQPASAPGVTVYSVKAAADKVAPQPRDLKPATLISAVRWEATPAGVRIVVDTNGAAQFKDFVLASPWRVVVDITGVRSAFGNKTTPVGAGSVERLRVGQPGANVVRLVLDTKSKVDYRVVREGSSLVITVGDDNNSPARAQPGPDVKAQQNPNDVKGAAQPHKPEVRVAGERIENKNSEKSPAAPPKGAAAQANLLAQANPQSTGQRVTAQPNRSLPLPAQPAPQPGVAKPSAAPAQPPVNRSPLDVQRNSQPNGSVQNQKRPELAFCDPGYVGGLISFDLRAGVDLRDMLRFISQQYGVNFIVDKSVSTVPVDIRVTDLPWNQVMESVLRANRLGAVCESGGRMIRIATLAAVKEEEEQQRAIAEEKAKQVPLVTKIIHLKYARAAGQLGSTGAGASGRGSSGGGGVPGASATGQGSLMSIVNSRLSPRGRIEIDVRTNSLIVTDLPEYAQVIEDMIGKLDRPEPQVEIEARIVIANRNFLRDIGNELAGGALGKNGRAGLFQTTPSSISKTNDRVSLTPGTNSGGSAGSSGSSGSSGSNGGSSSGGANSLGPNLVGPFADTSLRAGVANTVLGLTTGALGTGILSMALSASETKGQIRTIASPRVTTTDNKTAEIVNGVQIPVQTVSNNTITTTFVTAALRLEITPQIIEENGQVLMHVVAENNSVNFSLANQFNNGTPGIDTQSAESTVLVADGGTTVMGGINIDSEGSTTNRTPGVSRIPLLGELFKHRSTRREDREILFFLTPRIVRHDGSIGPRAPQRSSLEGTPNPGGLQRASVTPPANPEKKEEPKPATPGAAGKGGQ